jgi:urease accessory protein
MIIGTAAHIGEATVNGAEIFVAVSVIVLGVVLLRKQPPRLDIAIALFIFAGLVHGYALGESIAGAERAPLYAYFVGLALIQSAVALAAMYGARMLAARTSSNTTITRVLGGIVAGIGLAILVQQIMLIA